MKIITDAIKEDMFYYHVCSESKWDYELIIDNQKMQSKNTEFYILQEKWKSTASDFNKLIVKAENSISNDLF